MQLRDRVVELRRVSGETLRANPLNFRKHPKAQRAALQGVLEAVGIAGALLAYEHPDHGLTLIDGHLRAEDHGAAEWPVVILDVTEDEANLLLATHDPIAAMAEADAAVLDELLKQVHTDSDDVVKLLDSLAKDAGGEWAKPPEIVEDECPDAPAEPTTKPGDLWLLGEHRLLCGDCRNKGDVQRVLNGDRATVIFTDPPYGVAIGAKNRMLNSFQRAGRNLRDIVDDGMSPDQLKQSLLPAFELIRTDAMAPDATLFVCAPQGGELCMMMMMMMQEAGLKVRHVLIWKKNQPTFSMGRLDYDYQHEPILLTWGKRHKRPMRGSHRTSIWEVDKPRASAEHPTMKPVELYANAYLNNSDEGDVAFEPYSGSGTACIAGEQVGRIVRAIEIDPAYCDVAVERWQNLTGEKAKRG